MTSPGLLSFEDFERLPESPGKQELLDGELIELPPAKQRHMAIAKKFQKLLETVLDGSRVWFETGFQIRSGWLVPDISATWPDQQVVNDYFQNGPMIAVEVESPGNTAEELDRKVIAYLQDGAGEVWVVYPRTSSMLVHSRLARVVRFMSSSYPGPWWGGRPRRRGGPCLRCFKLDKELLETGTLPFADLSKSMGQ